MNKIKYLKKLENWVAKDKERIVHARNFALAKELYYKKRIKVYRKYIREIKGLL